MMSLILLRSFQESQIEFWLPIKEWPAYDVSSFGRVRSYWKMGNGAHGYCCYYMCDEPKILREHYDKRNYPRVILRHKGRQRVATIHRLVAETFLPNPDSLPQVNHRNAVKTDCRLGNLEHVSRSANMRHAYDSGLFDQAIRRGDRNNRTLASDRQVEGIRQLAALGITNYLIAKATGISASTIGKIVNRKTRTHKGEN